MLAVASFLALTAAQSIAGSLRRLAPLWTIVVAGTTIYLPIWIESRYLSAFFCIGALLVLDLARLPAAWLQADKAWRQAALAFPILCLVATLGVAGPRLFGAATIILRTGGDVRDGSWMLADRFAELRVPPGTPVASIGEAFRADWHRLARVRVIAEIPAMLDERTTGFVEAFWRLELGRRDAVLEAFSQAGARLAVATEVPAWADMRGWTHIPGSGFHYRQLGSPGDWILARTGD
jgi:hypothetical protein